MNASAQPVWDRWPTELDWRPLASSLTTVWILRSLMRLTVLALVALVALLVWIGSVALPWWLGGFAAVALLRVVTVVRAARSWGYAEREQDLLVKHGLLTRHLSIVPYGRIQLIDLSAGPLERMFGLTTVQVRTASMYSTTDIPGLDPPTAQAVRDRLAAHAAAAREGL